MKKISIFLLLICANFLTAQNNNYQFWEALLSNNRVLASEIISKNENNNSIEYLIINELTRIENGKLKTNEDFLPTFLIQKDFEYYLYAFWNENFLFNTYLETGFNDKNRAAIQTVANANLSHETIKDAIIYLESVLARNRKDWDLNKTKTNAIKTFRNWQYCGVFENLNESGLNREYEPESKPISTSPFDAESNGLVNWYNSKNNNKAYQFFTNHEEFGRGVNYAQTFITAEKEETVILRVGCGSAFKLWLNDVLIYENVEDVATELNAYNVKVTLPKGVNRLLLKAAEKTYGSYFIMSAMNLDGTHNTSLKDSSEYAEYNSSSLKDLKVEKVENEYEVFFKNRIKDNPDNFLNVVCLVNTYQRNNRYEEAKKLLLPYLEKHPKSSFIKTLLISVYSSEADYTSVNELNKNIELDDPDYYLPVLLKVIVFDELKRMSLTELEAFLKKMKATIDLELMHETADFIYNARKEDRVKVKKNLNNLIKLAKGNNRLLLRYAPLYASLFEEDDKTIKILKNIVDNNFDVAANNALIRFYDRQNKKDEILKILSSELDNMQTENAYLRSIVKKLHAYQKHKESLKYIDLALSNFPYSFVFQELKGEALLQIGKKKEALKAFKTSLSYNSNNKSLRKKIKDLNNEKNIIKELILEDAYDLIEASRGKELINNYGFNILYEDNIIELYGEGGGDYRYISIYEITSDNGIERFKEYNLGLSGNYSIIKSEIIKQDKSIVPAEKSGSNLVFNGLSIGDVIYIDYENSFSSSGRFYKTYSDRFMLNSYHPTLTSNLKIVTPKDYKLNIKNINGDTKCNISEIGDSKLYSWTVKNDPGLAQAEDYMPSDADIAEYIHLSTLDSWNEISIWYSDLVQSRMEFDSTVKEVFDGLFPNGFEQLSQNKRSKIIYNYIRNNFTYSYVSFKQSGFVPQKPSKTIKTSLGDCKDLSTLFVTLAKKANLEANLVLVLTSDYGYNSLVLPSTDFNHCIAKVKIDGKDQFLELTDKYLPYKSLPTSLRGATGLEINLNSNDKKVNNLFRLENLNRDLALSKNKVTLNLSKDKMNMVVDSEYQGHINSYYSSVFSEPNQEVVKKSIYNDYDNRIIGDITLNSVSNIERKDNDRVINFTSDITLNKKINKIGSISVLQLPIISNAYTSDIISLGERAYEIDYNLYENVDNYEVDYTVILDEDKKFTELPENVLYSFKDHKYEITYSKVKDNTLKVKIIATTSFDRIKAEDYPEFKIFVQSVLDAQEAFIGFK